MNTNEALVRKVTEEAKKWLAPSFDTETKEKVQSLLDNLDKNELIDAFYKNLEFGTGGLRGVMGVGTNRMNQYTVAMATQGLANYLKKTYPQEEISVAIGYDCRHNSRYFAEITANVFSGNDIKVYLFESLRPTPEVSFAIRYLKCKSGVMITASHNPPIYNGYKAYWADGAQMVSPHDVNTIEEVAKITSMDSVVEKGNPALITEIGKEIDEIFIEKVKSLSLSPEAIKKHHNLPIVYTPIHGTGVKIVPDALKAFGFTNIMNVPEQDVVSGDFPTVVSPNPEEPAALSMALERAEKSNAQLVLASDPDADRIGVAIRNKEGKIELINGNQICTLLTYYSIKRRQELGILTPKDYVIKTIVTTDLIRFIADKEGVKLYDCYTGFKWIADIIRRNEDTMQYIGGGEESYGYLWEDFIRDKSSVSACALFAELTAWALEKGLSIDELLKEIYATYGYFLDKGHYIVRPGRTGAEEIAQMMKDYRETPPKELAGSPVAIIIDYSSLKGLSVKTGETFDIDMPAKSNVLQYIAEDGSKLSIRPSGTEPKIKYYIGIREPLENVTALPQAQKKATERLERVFHQLGI
ncbi:phospho-sugar mutase [Porphyromonas circumdentaria]|uniref:Phosphoglucomutase n=1 Tax=Porphyromonas circumdentaria TaxID=29524 RepID=A0A1T4NGF7_9PORP|nr:phospho-sugar mutase [Porphyromonas circumdentaria]MBB6275681.1 phosphoglucomutase [Porphyromonas circumdentaria]SJZ78304.1 phosphoglucomutase [Porphyromonas circumdentaria]